LKVDPVNPDNVFLIGLDIYRTQNGGGTWTNQSGGDVHVDQHAVYIHPQDNDFVVLGNDGGLYISYNGGNTWTHNKTLPVTQFYTGALDFQFPERLYGGTQDNGTNRTMGGDTDDWERIFGGDGFYVLIDPVNNNYVYAESQYGNLGRSTNGGTSFSGATSGISSSDRFNWSCPVVFDPSDPSILYFGSNRLYRSTDRAVSWNAISGDLSAGPGTGNLAYHTLTTISVSAVNPEIIYTGSDDGRVHVSQDGGDNWTDISEGLPERWITRVAADPVEENIVYVTLSGYRWDEFQPHVFRSEDYGQNWADISGNLPEAPVNDIIINQPDNNILFVAADMGVFVSYDAGSEWMPLGEGLPPVVVNALVLHKPTNKLVAATYGRSMYSYDLEQDPMTGWTSQQPSAYLQVYPNPFRKKVFISFSGQSFKGRIRIFDLSGKLIREIDVPGKRTVEWNGEGQEGNRVPDGVYIIRLSHSHSRNWIKLVKH
ncbi:MAG: T9SS type A sorting domain-containing protein, partial [bacterium]